MKLLKKALLTFGLLVSVLYVISLFLPAHIKVERSVTIETPAAAVFPQVNDLKNWDAWSPWFARDPDINQQYSSNSAGEGAWVKWTSGEHGVGSGKQTIKKSKANKSLTTEFSFGKDDRAASSWQFDEKDGKTKVTWIFEIDSGWNPIVRYVSLRTERIVGEEFEEGLAKLKNVCEKYDREKKLRESRVPGSEDPVQPAEIPEIDEPAGSL